MLEKTLKSPLDNKEIKLVNPKGNQPWILTGRTDDEAEAQIHWLPDVKSWLIGKDPDAGKNWGQEEKGLTEYEMVEWHHWHNGHEFEQAPSDGEGQRSLGCCSPTDCKESDNDIATEQQQQRISGWYVLSPNEHTTLRNLGIMVLFIIRVMEIFPT